MAEETARVEKKGREKRSRSPASFDIEKLFMLPRPEKVRGRDGKTYEVFHRTGATGGAYTKDDLLRELGFKDELNKVERDAQKRYKTLEEVRSVVEARRTKLVSMLNSRVQACKAKLTRDYSGLNGLVPLMASLRIHSDNEERRLFIAGFLNQAGEFVIGNRDDGALWAIGIMKSGQAIANMVGLAHHVGKDLLNKGLSGQIRERLMTTLKG